MEEALKILNKHIDFSKDGVVDREEMIKAMQEYAEQQSNAVYNLFNKPMDVLKPLQELWRKENPRDKFTIPDATEFHKWIVNKVNQSKEQRCDLIRLLEIMPNLPLAQNQSLYEIIYQLREKYDIKNIH